MWANSIGFRRGRQNAQAEFFTGMFSMLFLMVYRRFLEKFTVGIYPFSLITGLILFAYHLCVSHFEQLNRYLPQQDECDITYILISVIFDMSLS